MVKIMRKEFEYSLNGVDVHATLERRGDVWVCESNSASCTAVDARTAVVGALGYGIGGEIWNSRLTEEGGE